MKKRKRKTRGKYNKIIKATSTGKISDKKLRYLIVLFVLICLLSVLDHPSSSVLNQRPVRAFKDIIKKIIQSCCKVLKRSTSLFIIKKNEKNVCTKIFTHNNTIMKTALIKVNVQN